MYAKLKTGSAFCVLRSAFCVLRSAFCVLRSAFCVAQPAKAGFAHVPKFLPVLLIALLAFAACGGSSPSDSPDDTDDTPTVATPVASPGAGNYDSAQTVELTCATSGAEIRYTTTGGDPAAAGVTYTEAITISATTTLKAIAVKDGMNNSAVLTAVYTITAPGQVAAPTASPGTGDYDEVQSVTLSTTTPGADIYYTLDGITNPTTASTPYEEGHPVAVTKTTTLKVIAVKEGMEDSAVLTEVYTITLVDDVEDFDGAEVTQVYDAANADDWEAALTGIREGGNDKNYVINIVGDFNVEGSTAATFGDVTGLTVSIRGDKTVSLFEDGATGNVLRIGAEQTVIVRDVGFRGMADNNAPLVYLSAGALTLRNSATVSGNTYVSAGSSASGGGVYVDGGTLTMRDTAELYDNTTSTTTPSTFSQGSGVYLTGNGTLTMEGDTKIRDNTASASAPAYASQGGGVYVKGGTFTMRDRAAVSGNTASDYVAYGGGVYIESEGTLIMEGDAEVSGNTASDSTSTYGAWGGGVYTTNGVTLTMRGSARVSGNTVSSVNSGVGGGGVYVSGYVGGGGTFTMEGNAIVSDNTASSTSSSDSVSSVGGGVFISGDVVNPFTMRDNAEISGNEISTVSSPCEGGGIGVGTNFTMEGNAKISGNTASSVNSRVQGGGVSYGGGRTFTMRDTAVISDNKAISTSAEYGSFGGGVSFASGTLIMEDAAAIRGNTASSSSPYAHGGGVYENGGAFQIESGIIYGNTADDDSNIVMNSDGSLANVKGAALYGSARRGTFDGDIFTPKGNLGSTDATIKVVNGDLIQP